MITGRFPAVRTHHLSNGVDTVRFRPDLLRPREFHSEAREFRYLDVDDKWNELTVPAGGLAFTWCQVPIVYELNDDAESSLSVVYEGGKEREFSQLMLSAQDSAELFGRTGHIRQLTVTLRTDMLFVE